MRKVFSLCFIPLFVSCATGSKTEFVYVQAFDAGVSYQKAIAQCEYEDHLQRRADVRADVDSGRGLIAILTGKPSNTQIYCMKRFGWELQERVQSLPTAKKTESFQSPNRAEQSNAIATEDVEAVKARRQLREHAEKNKARCTDQAYKAFYSKTPCSTDKIEEQFFLIDEKINDDDILIAKLVFSEMKLYEQHRSNYMRQYGSTRDKIFVSIHSRYSPMFDKNRNRLLIREITWGEYNKTRTELNNRMTDEMNAVPK